MLAQGRPVAFHFSAFTPLRAARFLSNQNRRGELYLRPALNLRRLEHPGGTDGG